MNKDIERHIHTKLEDIHTDVKELRLDVKDHVGRLGRAEADISWLKGHVRLVSILGITIIGSIITYYFTG